MNYYEKFLNTEHWLKEKYKPYFGYVTTAATFLPNSYTITTTNLNNLVDEIFYTHEKENTMSLFNWFLVESNEEGKEPTKSGFITAENEDSAREFIVRSLDKDLFDKYKAGDFYLAVIEVDSWEI